MALDCTEKGELKRHMNLQRHLLISKIKQNKIGMVRTVYGPTQGMSRMLTIQ